MPVGAQAVPMNWRRAVARGSRAQMLDCAVGIRAGTPENIAPMARKKVVMYLPRRGDPAKQELISRAAKLAYPISDGIPIMLPEEARKLD